MSKLTPSLLRSPILGTRKKFPEARVLAFRCPGEWTGGDRLQLNGETFLTRHCASELAMREALVEAEGERLPLVILTPLQENQLGTDILVRFVRRKLIQVEIWDRLRDLFQVQKIDPRVRSVLWLGDVLQEAGGEGPAPAANGLLTLEHLWASFFRSALGWPEGRPDPRQLLAWAAAGESWKRFMALEPKQRADVAEWVKSQAGDLGAYVLKAAEQGKRSVLLAGCLACEVIFDREAQGAQVLRDAAIRLEKFNGSQPVPRELGERLGQLGLEVLASWEKLGELEKVREAGKVLDRLLEEMLIEGEAWRSRRSPAGYEQRVSRFAAALLSSLRKKDEADFTGLWDALRLVAAHAHSATADGRVDRLRMALRLRQALATPLDDPGGFAAWATQYVREGSFMDWARQELLAGEGNEELAKSFSALLKALDAARDRGYRTFAESLAAWTESGSGGKDLLRVEEVLDAVCVPLARKHPLLLVVMDGMSLGVYRQMRGSLLSGGQWWDLAPVGEAWPLPCVAVLPSVTEVSRCSLLCGRLTSRERDDEASGFASHPGLVEASGAAPPRLFLKGDLVEGVGSRLSAELVKELRSKRRVVGAVVNAVDDHLAKGEQVHFPWSVGHVPVLENLLHLARECGRVVVVVSDHGHVFDQQSRFRAAEPGERYRLDKNPVEDVELRVAGSRVLTPQGWLIAPWREGLRYGLKKNGYHGGVSPQEMLVPLAVLSPGIEIQGWEPVDASEPTWWSEEAIPAVAVQPSVVPAVKRKKKVEDDLPLFAEAKRGDMDWKDLLLRSEVLQAQRKLAGRVPVAEAHLLDFLAALEAQGGVLRAGALAQRLALPPVRLRGFLAACQRLLNVEGYPVLSHDEASETVRLDLPLLKRQFEIES